MEAPTPASALIHSSTLVVMGVYLLLRFSGCFINSLQLLNYIAIVGAMTVAYGSIFAILTSDLKKMVAYSTISQIGYLICGFGFLAIYETLYYLIVHALCKALLFVFVGSIIHLCGGMTTLRKMGGIFYTKPFVGFGLFILCTALAGCPYTAGFLAKDFLILHFFSTYSVSSFFIFFC